jgi:hypothetical protein
MDEALAATKFLIQGKIRDHCGNDQPEQSFDQEEHEPPEAKSFDESFDCHSITPT